MKEEGGAGLLRVDLGRKPVAAVDSVRPEPVPGWADTRVLSAFQSSHPAAEVACAQFARLLDRAGNGDRLVVAVLVLRDQHGQAELRVRLERNREPVVAFLLFFGAWDSSLSHLFALWLSRLFSLDDRAW